MRSLKITVFIPPLAIGQKFMVDYRLEPTYEDRENENGHRQAYRILEKIPIPRQEVYLIGLRYKQEGWYHKAGGGIDPENYDPPYLAVMNTVKCALVTPGLRRIGFLVHWVDLKMKKPSSPFPNPPPPPGPIKSDDEISMEIRMRCIEAATQAAIQSSYEIDIKRLAKEFYGWVMKEDNHAIDDENPSAS